MFSARAPRVCARYCFCPRLGPSSYPTAPPPSAGEAVDAFYIRGLREGQAARGHHVEAAVDPFALVGREVPPPGALVPHRGVDPGGEDDVIAEVVTVGDVLEVGEDLGLGRVLLGPLPLLLQLRVEAVRVVRSRDVATGARVTVPVPGATDAVRRLEDLRPEAEPAQPVKQIEACEACAYDHRVEVVAPVPFHAVG